MTNRIEIYTKVNDTRSEVLLNKLKKTEFKITSAKVVEVYTINKDFNNHELTKIAQMLSNPISQSFLINDYAKGEDFSFAIEIGYLPGVTDNIAQTAKETIEDAFKIKFADEESVHTSTLMFIKGEIAEQDAEKIGNMLANNLIQRIHVKSHESFAGDKGMDVIVPKVKLKSHEKAVDEINLDVSKEELIRLGREGILNADGTSRGPLALEEEYILAIKDYFKKQGRNPNDIELESLAQTWSEHCKHTIFAAEIDEIKGGLFKDCIRKATEEIRKKKGKKDICVSVFKDNSGAIIFDENWLITDKAETHNTPSALDPFGGAITGIVGVNRDTLGFGLGAKPIINKYGFCVGDIDDEEEIFRDKKLTNKALLPKRILNGVIDGVNAGGNQSGIPTPQGFVYFNKSYKGKPLIFVGTVGLIPKEINGKPSYEKCAMAGDKIVMLGGKVGQDGIHGATFSSEALTEESPISAVQIGDPITQKKFSDAIVKEARDQNLYNSITDNGAGGLSCSVAEMAKECGGCEVELEKIPLKYPNLEPWKIWTSESQERMTLAIPEEKVEKFISLMERRGVIATVIGTFTDSGRCIVKHQNEKIMDIEMDFLHDGLPKKTLTTSYTKTTYNEPTFEEPADLTQTLLDMLERQNITSYGFISHQYDHNVQGTAVIGPVCGRGDVNTNTSITKPFLGTKKGIICSQALYPTYAEIDTYHMAACAIDTAIRNAIAVGGTLDHMALMDNFCWCSSTEKERLGQLKSAANACYEYAVKYETPYISGKDSMFNDFKGFDKNGNPIKISVLPTLLISSLGVIDDVENAVTMDLKFAEDLIYMIGETKNELGASEYFNYQNEIFKEINIGNNVPKVDAEKSINIYRKYEEAINQKLIASSLSPSIGGFMPALAKKAIAGNLGVKIDLSKMPIEKDINRDDFLMFSETQSRFIVSINPKNKEKFEKIFNGIPFAQIGEVTEEKMFQITGLSGKTIIKKDIQSLEEAYKKTFKDW
ncbi:MAG: AIR synthase-related protein [Candidatus Gracilibacteria bacterium]|jgi:phosphoribosylformylglycinamidine synthase